MRPLFFGIAVVLFFFFISPAHAQTTVFGNTHVEFQFEQNGNEFYLKKISNLDEGYSFTLNDHPLWSVTGLDPQTLAPLVVNEAGVPTAQEESISGGKKLTLAWNDLGVAPEVMDVQLVMQLDDDEGIADITLHVNNDISAYYLDSVDFHLHIPKSSEDDYTIIPWRGAHEIKNPAQTMIAPNFGTHFRSPSQGSMQLYAYYTQSEKGIYIATADEEGHLKLMNITGNGSELHYQFHQEVPGVFTPGIDYDSPYPIRLGVFEGKWWEAGQIYREWALQQEWAEKGKVEFRNDIPEWMKNMQLITASNANVQKTPTEWSNGFSQIKETYGLDHMMVWWLDWFTDPTYLTPQPQAPATAALLKSQGIYSTSYVLSHGRSTTNATSQLLEAQLLQRNGQPTPVWGIPNSNVLNLTIPYVQDLFEQSANVIASSGGSGVYFDAPEQFVDYSTSRSHPPGGGNYYTEGYREVMQIMKNEMKQIDPQGGVLFAEGAQENFIDIVDFVMTDFLSTPMTKENTLADRFIPLFQAVYHDYALTFISADRLYTLGIPTPDHYDAIHAIGFSAGNILSSREDCFIAGAADPNPICQFLGSGALTTQMPAMQPHVGFMKEMINARKYAKKFIAFGRMMAPLPTSANEQTYTFNDSAFVPGEVDKQVRIGDVITTVWRSNDNELGIVFTNHTPAEKTITYTLSFSKYGRSGTQHAYILDENGSTYLQAYTGNMARTETIPAKSVKVIRLSSTAPPAAPTPPIVPPTNPLPIIALLTPADNSTYAEGTTIPLRAQVTNAYDPQEVLVFKLYVLKTATTNSNPLYQTTLQTGTDGQIVDFNFTTNNTSSGNYTIYATATDANGVLALSPLYAFQVTDVQTPTNPTPITPTPTTPFCGDDICSNGENCNSCSEDCDCPAPAQPITQPTPNPPAMPEGIDWGVIALILGGGALLGGAAILFMQRR